MNRHVHQAAPDLHDVDTRADELLRTYSSVTTLVILRGEFEAHFPAGVISERVVSATIHASYIASGPLQQLSLDLPTVALLER